MERETQRASRRRTKRQQPGSAMNHHTAELTHKRVNLARSEYQEAPHGGASWYLERETRFELATSTLARLRSTN